jgi:Protein of unknown function (DUF2652)
MAEPGVGQGYLLIADLTGYTEFLTGTELEHANGVIEDLTGTIVGHLPPPLRLVKLEGDAVFVYAHGQVFSSGERVLELVEQCYVAFRDGVEDMVRRTTCTCAACARIGTLDLKFVVHFGEFVVQRRSGAEDLAGRDVILLHRLLKNSVRDTLGIDAYALLTETLVARMAVPPQLPAHQETYETIGTVECVVEDLASVAEAYRRGRRVVVTAEEADIEIEIHLAAPRPVAWDWYVSPERVVRFEHGITSAEARPNRRGRTGADAELHCAHGSGRAVRRILDWKPFDYFTEDLKVVKSSLTTPAASRTTSEFLDRPDGTTTLRYRVTLSEPGLLLRMTKPIVRAAYRRVFRLTERRFAELVERGEVE